MPINSRSSEIFIVPCTKEKIWDEQPGLGKVPAQDAYVSDDFRRWRRVAGRPGQRWLILSTEYGLIEPDKPIAMYEATASEALEDKAFHALLRRQGREFDLASFEKVVLLNKRQGSKKFQALVRIAVANPSTICVRKNV